ncbi:MAG TPA: hypothetical protein PLL30_15530 [Candidatus Krumholzibacteria bacterium]|nr:hypothetical protein [Candidatus Krumholzibacteria bacterium]HPD73182.1 hypothetical protein [Candidatus Krumholzibacteria bacterium]HRY41940.1 hypothetical protein [Candidatus Krumholzibacteria bacterium]
MALQFTVNGVRIAPGEPAAEEDLARAGLSRLAQWHRLVRRLPNDCQYWEAADPRVSCFDDEVEIYPCRHSYLDADRQWGTGCLVRVCGGRVVGIEVRVIEGVYAAGNLFERFVDAGRQRLGDPDRGEGREYEWRRESVRVAAMLAAEGLTALFKVDLAE